MDVSDDIIDLNDTESSVLITIIILVLVVIFLVGLVSKLCKNNNITNINKTVGFNDAQFIVVNDFMYVYDRIY